MYVYWDFAQTVIPYYWLNVMYCLSLVFQTWPNSDIVGFTIIVRKRIYQTHIRFQKINIFYDDNIVESNSRTRSANYQYVAVKDNLAVWGNTFMTEYQGVKDLRSCQGASSIGPIPGCI